MNLSRVRKLNNKAIKKGPVIYWMSRDQRVRDNRALLYAQEKAHENNQNLLVCFCLVKNFLGATLRHYEFMLKGLQQLEKDLINKNIAFNLLWGDPAEEIPAFLKKNKAGLLVTDFDSLRIKIKWKNTIGKNINIAVHEVDAHNIVPVWEASDKKEYAAFTIRKKITNKLDKYLVEFSQVKKQKIKPKKVKNRWKDILKKLEIDQAIKLVNWIKPGEKEARQALKFFVDKKLNNYSRDRNDSSRDGQSNLSPYLHFGQISAQRVALEVKKSKAGKNNKDAFLEELIIRRELADNFCYYEKNYDKFAGFPEWARKSLIKHQREKRQYLYSKKQLENAKTHDEIWNAAQIEMVKTGKMHGYMRMYWAKKILEWTKDPMTALKIAIYLNDKYELDGRDPNGYAGIAWSIGGVHDRPWGERKIYGYVRYMSADGLKRKFNIKEYIKKINQLNY